MGPRASLLFIIYTDPDQEASIRWLHLIETLALDIDNPFVAGLVYGQIVAEIMEEHWKRK